MNPNGRNIRANGGSPSDTAQTDGAGGGGAGGTVLIDAGSYNSNLNVFVNGGDGGHVNNGASADSCFGPGGGGGGGILWHSGNIPGNVSFNGSGGQAGSTVNSNAAAACNGSNNNAASGASGNSLTSLQIPASTTNYIPLSGSAMGDTTICDGGSAVISASGTASGGPIFNWSNGQSGGSLTVSPAVTTTYTVSITDDRGCLSSTRSP